jgi:dTDP-L-rhamnose 4-epimerase
MKVLITGGAGFIGRHLTARLQCTGHWVRWLDNLDPQIHGEAAAQPEYCHQADEMLIGDVRNRADLLRALQDVDVVVHLAAQTGTGQSMYRVAYYTDVNVGGTALLWDILANERMKVQKFVVASSRSIYGEGAYQCNTHGGRIVPEPRPKAQLQAGEWEPRCPVCDGAIQAIATPETSTPNPASLYACTKFAQEQISLTMGPALGVSTVALRFQNVYGPGQSLRNPYTGIISIFSNQLRQNLPIDIFEDGKETRDFVFVEDVAAACERSLAFNQGATVLNVGSGSATPVIDLAYLLKDLWKSQSSITVTGNFRVGDIRHNWADLQRLRALWQDWEPTELRTGLEKFVEWASVEPIFEDGSRAAAAELKSRNL